MTDRSPFRVSAFLTFAAAAACLGYAEAVLFPEIAVLAGLVVVGLAFIYRLESRAEQLSVRAANVVGLGITVVYVGWAAFRVLREARVNEYAGLGWRLLMLPLFGPILLLVVPAKLLRADKTARDWWTIYSIALTEVALAGTIADEPAVFVGIGVFAVLGVWSLAEFFRARTAGAIPAGGIGRPVPATRTTPEGRWLAARVALWAGLAGGVAVPLFLLTPRSSADKLEFGNPRFEIGYAGNQMIDLRRTASLEDNPDPVFEVRTAHPNGRPWADVAPPPRWRGTTLSKYQNGVWVQEKFLTPTAVAGPKPSEVNAQWTPPDFGPGTVRLTITMITEERSTFLADPVMWAPDQPVPVSTVCNGGLRGWQTTHDGTGNFARAACGTGRIMLRQYVQYTRPPDEPDLGPAFQLTGTATKGGIGDRVRDLLDNYPRPVREYTDGVVADLIRRRELPAEAAARRDPATGRGRAPDEHHEAVARALTRHLATDPSFTYTTELRRTREDLDPVVEFLTVLKSGHCERYAAALVMMLRSQGIPAVLVLGFRGAEHVDDGRWVVRQRDAHAWVEALVSRPARGAMAGEPAADWHWLSLDPTPDRSDDTASAEAAKGFWQRAGDWTSGLFLRYFVNYTPERREQAVQDLTDLATSPGFIASVVLLAVLVRRFRRRTAVPAPASSEPGLWFEQLLRILAAHGHRPQPGETPREFAAAVSARLTGTPAAALASVPVEWADAY